MAKGNRGWIATGVAGVMSAVLVGISLAATDTGAASGERPAAAALSATDCVSDPDGAAGQLKFSSTALSVLESETERVILVLRTGGSAGPVSATVRTADQGATAGTDYDAVDTTVTFPDGDATVRLIRVPIIQDSDHENVETISVSLSDPICATIGPSNTVVVTIHDDDPVSTFRLGGTVSGLEGTGLVLRTNSFDEINPGNGEFVFSQGFQAGSEYAVTVRHQPGNPSQVCTVTNGVGVMPEAAVSDVFVTCETPAVNPHLDTTFGSSGIVTTPGIRGAQALVVQPDGKIVTAGDDSLARYHPDGSPDTEFGTNGRVSTGLDSGFGGHAIDVTLQPDGSIVGVGVINNGTGTGEDFAVQRYDANGVPDSGFGTGGTVVTDFNGGFDLAYAVAVQADGAILVAGHAGRVGGFGNDFALARYTPAGVLDESYDGDGRVTTQIAGDVNFGHALALQPDGKAVVAGRVTDSADENFGVLRYLSDGALDPTFNGSGFTLVRFGVGSYARGVTVDTQGRIVVVGHASAFFVSGNANFAVARLDASGALDVSFDGDGLVTTDFADVPTGVSPSDFATDVVVHTDGRIVVVGSSQFNGVADVAATRYESDGRLDLSFAEAGRLTVDVHGGFDSGQDVAIQPTDGRIVVAGSAANGVAIENAVARLLP